jgi:hypothetical protein
VFFLGDLRTINLTAFPDAQRPIDSLTIIADDFAGNSLERTLAFMPGEDLSIRFLACHPNPFTARVNTRGETVRQVRFAFLLTDVARDVTLTIHTVSGKNIKSWKLIDLIGYQEVAWDGRDRSGHRIGNGTYYAKLIASNDRKKVKKIIRIAKLEGY